MTHDPTELLKATAAIVVAVANGNRLTAAEVPGVIADTYRSLASTGDIVGADGSVSIEGTTEFVPAVSVRKSTANPDHIISMIDGKPYKTLRRHLAGHGLTPDEYRARYNLPATYPMVAATYSEARRAMAKKIGLGRKPATGMQEG